MSLWLCIRRWVVSLFCWSFRTKSTNVTLHGPEFSPVRGLRRKQRRQTFQLSAEFGQICRYPSLVGKLLVIRNKHEKDTWIKIEGVVWLWFCCEGLPSFCESASDVDSNCSNWSRISKRSLLAALYLLSISSICGCWSSDCSTNGAESTNCSLVRVELLL